MLAGFNHFFIDESALDENGVNNWCVPSGIFVGQVLTVRKTCDFQSDVNIKIKNQDLCIPNNISDVFILKTTSSFASWCWDGKRWYLEHLN